MTTVGIEARTGQPSDSSPTDIPTLAHINSCGPIVFPLLRPFVPTCLYKSSMNTKTALTLAILAIATLVPSVSNAQRRQRPPADQPQERRDENSRTAHEQLLAKTKQGQIDLYFAGDSILRRWGATDYPALLANFQKNFHGWNAANFAWGGDSTNNIIWRMQNGELEGVNPKAIVLMAGTNNISRRGDADAQVADITKGLKKIIDIFREEMPNAPIIVTGILPRNDNMAAIPIINRINENLAGFAEDDNISFLNINDKLADEDGKLFEGMSRDRLHPSEKAYQIWADGLKPMLTEIMGPPAEEDNAPPATGDPSASR